jgi:hypothetical protein
MNTKTSFIATAPPRGNAWRMPARKKAGKQTAQNPEVSIPHFTSQSEFSKEGTVSGCQANIA